MALLMVVVLTPTGWRGPIWAARSARPGGDRGPVVQGEEALRPSLRWPAWRRAAGAARPRAGGHGERPGRRPGGMPVHAPQDRVLRWTAERGGELATAGLVFHRVQGVLGATSCLQRAWCHARAAAVSPTTCGCSADCSADAGGPAVRSGPAEPAAVQREWQPGAHAPARHTFCHCHSCPAADSSDGRRGRARNGRAAVARTGPAGPHHRSPSAAASPAWLPPLPGTPGQSVPPTAADPDRALERQAWRQVPSPSPRAAAFAVWPRPPPAALAVGCANCSASGVYQTLILHWNGSTWSGCPARPANFPASPPSPPGTPGRSATPARRTQGPDPAVERHLLEAAAQPGWLPCRRSRYLRPERLGGR